jgi:acetylornithine deacetylase/succinyl-diaminopimelate desuccinylase-like protein
MLHTSISPDIIKGGYQVNVIPSEAEATLDIRALPDENIAAFYDTMRKVINDPSVEAGAGDRESAPGRRAVAAGFRRLYQAVEAAYKKIYGVITIPLMQTGATDMAFLRAKGVQCYGVGRDGGRRGRAERLRAAQRPGTDSRSKRCTSTCSFSGKR